MKHLLTKANQDYHHQTFIQIKEDVNNAQRETVVQNAADMYMQYIQKKILHFQKILAALYDAIL